MAIREKMLIFDLDGTLLNDDKIITAYTLHALQKCRSQGCLLVIATARSEYNARQFISQVDPDFVVSCDGALIVERKRSGEHNLVFVDEFTGEEVRTMIRTARELAGPDVEITVDTRDEHFWNYKADPRLMYKSWGDPIYTDYQDFCEAALKVCVELSVPEYAQAVAGSSSCCSVVRFSDGNWYKLTKAGATKGNAVKTLSRYTGIPCEDMIAFGDDYVDMEMLKLCGKGIAPANAVSEVRAVCDLVVESNQRDGIAQYLEKELEGNE